MKNKAVVNRASIPLRRRLRIYYNRAMLGIKCLVLAFLCLAFFTHIADPIKYSIKQQMYEATGDLDFVLENVIISGQKNITIDEVVFALNADTGTPIFAINLEQVRKALEQNTWVKRAIVSRRLPKTIYISITERVPVAIWQHNQKLHLVDKDGKIIYTNSLDKFSGLLHVVGDKANLHADSLAKDLAKSPEIAKKVVSAVRYGDRRWNLTLDEGIIIKMPEHQHFEKALSYLTRLHENGKLFGQDYKSIDLRDNTKYYFAKHSGKEKDKK